MIDPKSLRIGNTERNYKAMNNLEKEIATAIEKMDRETNHPLSAQDQAKAAASVCMKWMCEFREWYDKLSPAEKCTVWPPAGSGSGTGLYNMQTEDIVDKFISYKKKLATPTEPDTKEEKR